jgi:hypothetical protein
MTQVPSSPRCRKEFSGDAHASRGSFQSTPFVPQHNWSKKTRSDEREMGSGPQRALRKLDLTYIVSQGVSHGNFQNIIAGM